MNPKLFWLVTAIFLVVRGHPSQAQQSRKTPPRIGFLSGASLASTQDRIDAFRQALRGLGYVEGKNLLIDWRFADGDPTRLPSLAVDLVQTKTDAIVAAGGEPASNRHHHGFRQGEGADAANQRQRPAPVPRDR